MRNLLLIWISIVLAACASPPTPDEGSAARSDLQWPPGPVEKRIEFVREFSTPEELGIRKSALRRMLDTVVGEKNMSMVRPYAIAVLGQRTVVADPGAHAVHLFDLGEKSYEIISSVDDLNLRSPVGVALGEDRIFIADSELARVLVLDHRARLLASIDTMQRPTGLAFHAQMNRLYVADTIDNRISVFDRDGKFAFSFGQRGTGDGELNYPSHLHAAENRLLVNDNMNFRVQAFDLDGEHIFTFGSHGDGSGDFSQPKGLASDSDGNIYVAGAVIDRVQVFSSSGAFLLAFGSEGRARGEFLMPAGLTIAGDMIYVVDSYNRRVQVFRYLSK